MKRDSKSLADRLAKHFDEDYLSSRSGLRDGARKGNDNYNPTSSWEGRSQNPREFSRLEHVESVPFQVNRPCTMSGAAVILLENPDGMKVFNVDSDKIVKSNIPITREQRDVGMVETNLSATVPIVDAAKNSSRVVVMEKSSNFCNMKLQSPTLVVSDVPEALLKAGPNHDRAILNPKQRLEIMHFEKQKQNADKLVKKAIIDRQRTREIMKGPFHHRGVLMVDSSDNLSSEIYGDKAKKELEKIVNQDLQASLKRQQLCERVSAISTNGNIIVPDTISDKVPENKSFQHKTGDFHGLSFEETKSRLFLRENKPVDPRRTQAIRDSELLGKNFNIISNTRVEHWPSKVPYQEDRILLHPSQTSLEGPRNLQGGIRPRPY